MKRCTAFSLTAALLVSMVPSLLFGQKANFKLADKFYTDRTNTMMGSLSVRANWLKDADIFWYRYKTSDGVNFYLVDAQKQKKEYLFDRNYLAAELAKITHRAYNEKELPVSGIEFSKKKDYFSFMIDSLKFRYRMSDRHVSLVDTLHKKAEKEKLVNKRWANFSPDSSWVVFAKNHNLFIMKTHDSDSVEIKLTEDGERWYSYASDAGDTTQNKRRRANARWFKDSRKLYVKRSDYRQVKDLFVINSLSSPRPTLETYKYAMPGEKDVPQDELIVFDVDTKKRVDIEVVKWKDQAIGGVYFNGGGIFLGTGSDKIYFARRDRTWSKIDLCVADTETGKTTVLISEESKPYFNTRYCQLAVLNEGKDLVWWSERDGWGHLYLYDGEGRLKRRLTSGPFVVGDIAAIDSTGRELYFSAFGREKERNPYFYFFYKVNLDRGGLKPVTPEDVSHGMMMSESRKYFVDTYSTVDRVPVSVLRDNTGKVLLPLEETDISLLSEAGWKMPEPFTVKAADGITDIYGVMWKPFDFDPEKKYPIISLVYPGPQTEPFPVTFSASRTVSLAQVGFIVVAVGNRGGSPRRSKYYHNFGYGNNRDYPLADNKAALEQLASRYPFIDLDRVGIYGHSGGGNMSTAAMFTHPDFYKVAVSSSGNHDNNIYNIWWGEVHYGVKEVEKVKKSDKKEKENDTESEDKQEDVEKEIVFKAKYDNNWSIAKNLKGHLLLVTGDIDNNVHPANTIRVVNALIEAGKRFDFMIMPGQRHGYGKYNKYFQHMLWRYFARYLLDDVQDGIDMYLYQ